MYQMLSHLRGSVCVPANRSGSHRSDQYRAALIFSSVMGSLDHSIPPGKSSAHLCIPLSFYFISFVESGSHRPRLHPFVPNLPHQSALSLFFSLSSSAPLFHHSHVSPQLLLCDIPFLLLPPLPPRRRVSAPAHPKRQPLRVEAGQRGQRPVGEADGPLRGPPQVRWDRVSSRT